MSNKLTIELDCTSDDCLYESGPKAGWLNMPKLTKKIKAEAKKHGLTARLVDPNGPGGGCPVYAFTGTPSALRAYCHTYAGNAAYGDDLFLETVAPFE